MRSYGLLLILVVGAAISLPLASTAMARPSTNGPWIVRDLGHGVGTVAGHRTRTGTQNLQSLVRAWGPPTTVRLRRYDCLVIWKRPAARVVLRSYGLPPKATYCSPKYGLISTIDTTGPRWRTDRGLGVGNSEQSLAALYPTAFLFGTSPRSWGLRAFDTMGIEGAVTVAGIYARVERGTVVGFFAPIGAEGD